MPGKFDYGKIGADYGLGQFFPGENAARSWSEGFIARYALQAADTNPHNQEQMPDERKAWADGWETADQNSAGLQYGPAVPAGPPGALPP